MSDLLKFLTRVITYLIVSLCVIGVYFYVFKSNIPLKKRVGRGVYNSIEKSKKSNSETKKLVLGDSVCAQMYPNQVYNDTINSLACNHAVTVVGYYHLLKNFLENFQGSKENLEVYFVYRPSSFRNNVDQRYTFNYFLKPFNSVEYKKDFTASVNEAIEKIPFAWLSEYSFIKKSDWAPKFRTHHNPHDFKMAPIAAEYLLKMEALCQLNDVSFKVRPTFMSNEFSEEDFDDFKAELHLHGVSHLFLSYFEKIEWLDASNFGDGAHIKKPLIESLISYNHLNL